MKWNHYLFVLCLCIFCCVEANGKLNSLRYYEGTFDELVKISKDQNRLFFVVFYHSGYETLNQRFEQPLKHPFLVHYANHHYLTMKMDLAQKGQNQDIAQLYGVTQVPSILIFNSYAEVMCQMNGVPTYQSLLDHLKYAFAQEKVDFSLSSMGKMQNANPVECPVYFPDYVDWMSNEPAVHSATPATKQLSGRDIIKQGIRIKHEYEPHRPYKASPPSADLLLELDGLEQFSPKLLPQVGYGIVLDRYLSEDLLLSEIKTMTQYWNRDIWAFGVKKENETVYYLVLGTFEESDHAISFQDAIRTVKGGAPQLILLDAKNKASFLSIN